MNPRLLTVRWLRKELPALKAKYPMLMTSGENETFVVIMQPSLVRAGKPVVITIDLGKHWPHREPNIEVAGYNSSFLSNWSPEYRVVDLVAGIFEDVRNAENNSEFRAGRPYTGAFVLLQNKSSDEMIGCAMCQTRSATKCKCCDTPCCSKKCQKILHPQ